MPEVAISPVVRAILSADINTSADDVVKQARLKGVKAPDASIRGLVYNIRGELKKKGVKPAPAPAAARTTAAPKPAPKVTALAPSSSSPDLSSVLANVALVNTVVGACGGPDQARKVAEAVKACGGVEAFLKHLELVAGIRGATA